MNRKLKLLSLLAIIPAMSACTTYEYPDFGNLKDGEKYDIGILLPVTHDALNKAAQGFKDGLKEAGWEGGKNLNIITKNALGNSNDQSVMAKDLISSCDLTLGLGTGASIDLTAAQYNRGSKNPIMFTAVTDPVAAGLVESMENKTGYVCGTSDAQPIDKQIDLISEAIPELKKVGILYTVTEDNSRQQAIQAKTELETLNITADIRTCNNSTDVSTAVAALISDNVQAIYIPTDNNVAANMGIVKNAVENKGILVICGEESMVKNGGHLTFSISYTELGKETGRMAAQILSGEKMPSDLPVVTTPESGCTYYMHSANLEDAGITLPSSLTSKCTDLAK